MTTTSEQRPHLPSAGRRTPVSTYRLQLGPDLTFRQAQNQLDYYEALGVTDLYLSPILQAAPGSTHGYDVVDHAQISDTMGGRKAFERFAKAAHERGLGIIVDVVPNHMAVPTPLWHNKALWSVLKDGPQSPYAAWFDGSDETDEGFLMPMLGARIGTCLANDEIHLENLVIPGQEELGEQPVLTYYDHVFPVRGGTETLPLPLCIKAQHYRLAYWKVADEELNFRRFFDVDTLVAVRVEEEEVFDATHALLLELYNDGHIDGFRIDHPDGLADPRGYLRRLSAATGGAWIAAEKILEGNEMPPDDWPVAGTTGYDASWRIHAMHCDPLGAADTGTLALQLTGDIPGTLPEVIDVSKREITTTSLFAEVHRIATLVNDICRRDIMLRDHTFRWIRECVTELVIAFERYRAYVVPGEEADEEAIEVVLDAAKKARARLDPELHDTLEVVVDLVLGREVGVEGHSQRDQRDELVVRFQQVCGAVQAKGVEDTAYYRWTQLVALNEVGGSPVTWNLTPDQFHEWAATMAEAWPATMTCGTTHDTKRGEDVRSRIGVISQYASEWREMITELHPLMDDIEGHTENLLWQILAGTWTDSGPIEEDRLSAYALKAAREQKLWTSWTSGDTQAEQAMVETLAALRTNPQVLDAFGRWYEMTADAVRTSVLSRKAVQLTCLGVADVYQGCETLQNYLVDPDNRRPVDYKAMAKALKAVQDGEPKDLAAEKLLLTHRILELRKRRPDAFVGKFAAYRPLPTSTGHVISYGRGAKPDVVVVAERLYRTVDSATVTEHTVVLPRGNWSDILTGTTSRGGSVTLSKLLSTYPVAVLERTDA
ncbi:malto-oligosyltrehalose synthase [Nigerium massiliense]|uniref:malto-oligosyltrehalose synthase n=1 Tax=Nigerium massiliense TaxID=1522317 RepID=UPI00058B156E|nr:malto-oligosyltrehalose synthase [Nigerium massiliense]